MKLRKRMIFSRLLVRFSVILLAYLIGYNSVGSVTIRVEPFNTTSQDTIAPDTDLYFDIYMNNNDGFIRRGYSMPLVLFSPDSSINEIIHIDAGVAGPLGSIQLLNGFKDSTFWDVWNVIDTWSFDGLLPDTFCHTTAGITGWPDTLDEQVYIRLAIRIEQEGLFCIDSTSRDTLFDWLFESPSPSFNGPYCWQVLQLFTCGDVNSDIVVNIFDITYLISYLYLEGPPPEIMESADVNNDGTVNIFDITFLISYLYLEGPQPTCP